MTRMEQVVARYISMSHDPIYARLSLARKMVKSKNSTVSGERLKSYFSREFEFCFVIIFYYLNELQTGNFCWIFVFIFAEKKKIIICQIGKKTNKNGHRTYLVSKIHVTSPVVQVKLRREGDSFSAFYNWFCSYKRYPYLKNWEHGDRTLLLWANYCQ